MSSLEQVLRLINTPEEETSSVKTAAEKTTVETDLESALTEIVKEASAKTADTSTPAKDLEKIASTIANAENEALMKEAEFYGSAVADGFMARLTQYHEAAEKLAAEDPNSDMEKFAEEHPELIKQAAELGYQTTHAQLEELHKLAYDKGYNDTVEAIYKFAHDNFMQGFEDCVNLLEQVQ